MTAYNGYLDEVGEYLTSGRGGISQDAVRAQVQSLKRGEWTNTLFEAIPPGERNRVRVGATSVGQAALKVMYWLAALGRVERDSGLLPKIQALNEYTLVMDENPKEIERMFVLGLLAIADKHNANANYVRTTFQSVSRMTQGAKAVQADEGGALLRATTLLSDAPDRAPTFIKRKAGRLGRKAQNALEQESKTAKGILWGVGLTIFGLAGFVIYQKVKGMTT